MSKPPLTRAQACERLRALEPEILALGVGRLALFGSVARDEAGPDRDVDVLVQFLPGRKSLDRFLLERVLAREVELVTTEALSPHIGPHILAGAADVLRAA